MTRDAAREAEITRLIDHLENGPLDGSHLGAAAKHLDALLAENAALRRALEPLARVALPEDFHKIVADELVPNDSPCFYAPAVTCGAIRTARKLVPTPPAGGAHG